MTRALEAAFLGAEMSLVDQFGDGVHWRVVIKAREFQGMSLLEQHRSVYAALGTEISSQIHALSIETHELPSN